ncbi:hypothetical protein [Devosia sp.]|uniref:hypothetical protein n=1 Tax=Devosia sp. TaxID=1871048 RepID=UPI001ACDF38C|nr:hypothetical protein [Devosia sp.]MBN9310415.1 hypothetical protein [Devosia sp.]
MFWALAVGVVGAILMVLTPGWRSWTAVLVGSIAILAVIWLGTNPTATCPALPDGEMCRSQLGLFDLLRSVVVGGPALLVGVAFAWRVRSRIHERREAAAVLEI